MLDEVERPPASPVLRWTDGIIEADRARDRFRRPRVREDGNALHGRIDGRRVVEFSANDYLGLSTHPAVRRAAARAALELGVGATGSRHLSGSHAPMLELEERLAAFEGTASATLAPSGYAANMAVLEALGGEDAVIFSDALNHASIVDGCRASRARVEVYRHRDVEDLAQRVARARGRPVIVSDSVFSTEGTIADVPSLAGVARQHGAWLVVDEAHATGVVGPGGAGVVTQAGISSEPNVVKVVTFSKALGAAGGAVCGGAHVRQLLLQRGRPLIYSTALPHPTVAAVIAALDVLHREAEHRELLRRNTALLHRLLDSVASDHHCVLPMLAIETGNAGRALRIERELWGRGWMVHALRPPTVPEGTSRLRLTVSALHDPDDIDGVARAVREALQVIS
jgi:8-amino-7-oxononanoate synthase